MLTQMTLIAIALGYLAGSIPFGLILSKIAGYGDIRKIGSGNIGATNVLRTGNKKLAFATLLLDGGKGAFAIALLHLFPLPDCTITSCAQDVPCYCMDDITTYAALCGFFAILGHMFPVWLKFKGGKGVATTLGVLLVAAPLVGLACCAIWLLTALTSRISSLSALVAIFMAAPLAHFIYGNDTLDGICGLIALFVYFKHRENIKRLLKGEEPKIGKKK